MSDSVILFTASENGTPVTVAHATESEVAAVAGPVLHGQDVLEQWSLVAFRSPKRGTKLHALGWRMLLGKAWITSPVLAVDLARGAVRTRSGNIFLLSSRDCPELDPQLRDHLAYALREWGFDDVR